jgi:lipopolysaccharide/colanic/teichoic acid biosynthesis glycosyltransferase
MRASGRGRRYCRSVGKRAFDLGGSLAALVVLSPLFLVVGLVVLIGSGWPLLFAQERVGRDGRPFRLLKFRTMRPGADAGLPLTGRGDPRITGVGRLLRSAKLDELPQLVNVLRGEMSIVGPRPEVPRYVAGYDARQRSVLLARPGLTDPATLCFRAEEELLGAVPEAEREGHYLRAILPRKLDLNLAYIENAGFWSDIGIVLRTVGALVRPGPA